MLVVVVVDPDQLLVVDVVMAVVLVETLLMVVNFILTIQL